MKGLGSWAFLVGVILAVVLGALGLVTSTITWVLVVLGVIVGLLNITEKEAQPFLLAGVALVIVAALGRNVLQTVTILGNIVDAIVTLFVPATAVVAIKEVFGAAKD